MQIFEPMDIGSVTLKNRLIRSATWLAAASAEGEITDELVISGGCPAAEKLGPSRQGPQGSTRA